MDDGTVERVLGAIGVPVMAAPVLEQSQRDRSRDRRVHEDAVRGPDAHVPHALAGVGRSDGHHGPVR